MASLDAAIDRAIGAADQRNATAIDQAVADVNASAERLDETLAGLIEFEAAEGQALGFRVLRVRESVGWIVWSFNALSAVLAVFATALAVVTLRRQMRSLEVAGELAELRAKISEERSEELDQFAGRIAHDILSPLAAVGLALDIAERCAKAEDMKALEPSVQRGKASLARVRRIVDGLLDFARAGAKPAAGASADVRAVVENIVDEVRHEVQDDGIDVSSATAPSCMAACSPGVLTSIVANLVRNAAKHMGDSRERRIVVRAVPQTKSVRIEVEDTGPGVPPELAETIFEPFVRLGSAAPGIGLGLATVKRLATAHGGRVGHTPRVGGGSIFWVELPYGLEKSC
jgi:signal transduction histidine kinase